MRYTAWFAAVKLPPRTRSCSSVATAKDTRVGGTFSSWKDPDMLSLPPMAAVPQIFWASKAPSRAAAGFPQEQGSTVRSKYS